ncbi:MAG: hypothetical protein RLZZ285_239, partial [Actinomycetota bacterium]
MESSTAGNAYEVAKQAADVVVKKFGGSH